MSSPWYETAFGADYLARYAHRDRGDALRALAFLQDEVTLDGAERILDLCCGAGRHLVEMRRAGLDVVGLDLSRPLLREAAAELDRQAMARTILQGSMDCLPFVGAFDLIVNLFTSFGYFDTDEANAAVFRQVAGALRPGGRFVIDFLNAPRVRATLVPRSRETTPGGEELDVRRAIEGDPPRVVKRMHVLGLGDENEITESVRLFERAELEAMLDSAGLTSIQAWGDFDATPHDETSPRCILAAVKDGN